MRGCIFVVVTGLAVLAAGAWFGAPPLAAALVRASLGSAGFAPAEPPAVDVSFASPADLIAGRATTVRIVAGAGHAEGVSWRSATIELGDVDLLGARFATVDIDLDQPTFQNVPDAAGLGAVRLTAQGPGEAAATRIAMSIDQFRELGRVPLVQRLGDVPDDLRFVAPDVVSGTLSGQPISAVIRVDSGALILAPDVAGQPPIELFQPAADLPFRLEDVVVEDGDLVLLGRLDAAAMVSH